MGRMAFRHSWQTGKREILIRGSPQTRQSDGNKTAKRLSAIWEVQLRSAQLRSVCVWLAAEAIEGLVPAPLAWLARILSSLLLKTASVWPANNLARAIDPAIASGT
jgi:hypothetical protein